MRPVRPSRGPEVRAVHARDVPDFRLGVLRRLQCALGAPQHEQDPDHQTEDAATLQAVNVGAQFRPDDRELGEGRVLDPLDE